MTSSPIINNNRDVLFVKTFLLNAAFVAVMLVLWLIGKCTGRRNHARNAMIAMFTLMQTALVKSNTRWIDCTDGELDSAPCQGCPGSWTWCLLLVVYSAFVPLVLWWALRRDAKVPWCLCCKCFDSPDKGERFSREGSYGWVTKKYMPSTQWFEVAFIAYKVAMVFTAGACLHTISPGCGNLSSSSSIG
jgi:hypothetical protein